MKLTGKDLTCERGERLVFRDFSFSVAAGQLLVLKGPNGAGKTSLLRMIAGLIEPAAGQLTLDGGNQELAIGQQSHFVAHHNPLKRALTVRENVEFWAGFMGGDGTSQALETFGLSRLAEYSTALLSAGQLRRLNLCRLKLARRVLWLLDEPTVGLDANSTDGLRDLMQSHLDDGGMIVATTHIDLGMQAHSEIDFAATGTVQ